MTSTSVITPGPPVDDSPAPRTHAVLELHVAELRQLFNSMDPAPFRERDLDPRAQDYIVDWAKEVQSGQPLSLVIHVNNEAATPEDADMLREAVKEYFSQRARSTWRKLRRLFKQGRLSLLIGLTFLGGAIVAGESIASLISKDSYAGLVRESLVIGGWVALWRPIEIFLYDWWPIRAEALLYEKLSKMNVRLLGTPRDTEPTP